MTWMHPVLALVLAVLFGAILVGAMGWRHPRRPGGGPSLLFLLLLLFPLLWATAVWAVPVGPTILGAAIVPMLLLGLLIALVIAVLAGPRPGPAREAAEADAAVTVYGFTFWLLMILAAASIVAAYVIE